MFNELTEEAGNELAVQNECSREEFNFKLAGQIDFAMSELSDLGIAVFNSLIVQTDQGKEITEGILKTYRKLAALKEGLV